MVEVIGDPVKPSSFVLPSIANASLPASPQKGQMYYDSTNDKIVVWTGAAFETITSA